MMNKVLIGLMILLACQGKQEQGQKPIASAIKGDTIIHGLLLSKLEQRAVEAEMYKTYWGYRFHLQGDFDGDGQQEKLTERLISTRTGKEIAKFCGFEEDTVSDCWWTNRVNWFRQPECLLQCSNPRIGDFIVSGDSSQTVGIVFLQNVGDLNRDGSDEIVYVEDLGGCDSGIRFGHLATFKNGKWKRIIDFETREVLIPNTEEDVVKHPEDLSKEAIQNFENNLNKEPKWFIKQNGKVFFHEYQTAEYVLSELKINW